MFLQLPELRQELSFPAPIYLIVPRGWNFSRREKKIRSFFSEWYFARSRHAWTARRAGGRAHATVGDVQKTRVSADCAPASAPAPARRLGVLSVQARRFARQVRLNTAVICSFSDFKGDNVARIADLVRHIQEHYDVAVVENEVNLGGNFSASMYDIASDMRAAIFAWEWDELTGQALWERCAIWIPAEEAEDYSSTLPGCFSYVLEGQTFLEVPLGPQVSSKVLCRILDGAFELARLSIPVILASQFWSRSSYAGTPVAALPNTSNRRGASAQESMPDEDVPERIWQLEKMFNQYDDGFRFMSSYRKARSEHFREQALFMEDYTDDVFWRGVCNVYYPMYEDLDTRSLRGYFAWRTNVRKGKVESADESYAYLYIYELLCGVGADDPVDALSKMDTFITAYLEAVDGMFPVDVDYVEEDVNRWRYEFAIVHNLAPDIIEKHAPAGLVSRDRALTVLKSPDRYTDDQIYDALCRFAERKLTNSAFIKKTGDQGKGMFARLWRYLIKEYRFPNSKRRIFTYLFGGRTARTWDPLSEALHWEQEDEAPREVVVNECRSYVFKQGEWQEKAYRMVRGLTRFNQLIHAADRLFREELGVGAQLKEKKEEQWAVPAIRAFFAADRAAAAEAARDNVKIDFSELAQIRKDAKKTQESLLVEDETDIVETILPGEPEKASVPNTADSGTAASEAAMPSGLDDVHQQILRLLLEGEDPSSFIAEHLLMPSIVADTINEQLFDEIGDNVLDYDGTALSLVEDYRDEVTCALGGVLT